MENIKLDLSTYNKFNYCFKQFISEFYDISYLEYFNFYIYFKRRKKDLSNFNLKDFIDYFIDYFYYERSDDDVY